MRYAATIALLLCLGALLGHATAGGQPQPQLPAHAMKGYELYSWEAEQAWHFSLLVGTNRLKTDEEVRAHGVAVTGVEDLKVKLGELAEGEEVFWLVSRIPGYSLPPPAAIGEVQAFCRQRGIKLDVEDGEDENGG